MIKIKNDKIPFLVKEHIKALKPIVLRRIEGKRGRLFNYIKNNIEFILGGTPQELEKIIDSIPSTRGKESLLSKIFSYKSFSNKYSDTYGAYGLAQALDVKICSYCNRLYTFTLQERRGKTRPEFDHFFSQKKYPYLALSFFNLIPSCHICNSNLKGTAEFTLLKNIHPYIEGYENEVKFRIQLKDKSSFKISEIKSMYGVNFFNGALASFDVKLKVLNPTTPFETRVNNNIDIFHLETLYNGHKDQIVELMQKAEIYSHEYINSLFKEYEGKLFSSISDVYQMLLSNYISYEDFDKRVLSKLTRDISEELGIIQ